MVYFSHQVANPKINPIFDIREYAVTQIKVVVKYEQLFQRTN